MSLRKNFADTCRKLPTLRCADLRQDDGQGYLYSGREHLSLPMPTRVPNRGDGVAELVMGAHCVRCDIVKNTSRRGRGGACTARTG